MGPRVRYGLRRVVVSFVAQMVHATLRGARALVRQRRIYLGHGTTIAWDVQCSGEGDIVLGDNVSIESGTAFHSETGGRIEIGSHTRVGRNCILVAMRGQSLHIGKRTEIGDSVIVRSVAGIRIGDDACVRNHVEIGPRETTGAGRLEVGNRVFISAYTNLDVSANVTIADDVAISTFCSVYTHNHTAVADSLIWNNEVKFASVQIECGAWIGHGASIMPGVQIGPNSVVGALSVVTKAVGANMIVGGVPAKLIRYTSPERETSA